MKRRARAAWCAAPPGDAFGRGQRYAPYDGPPLLPNEPQNGFLRGAIAAGLLAAIAPEVGRQEAMRRALQGGTALAAGIASANAIDRRDYGSALLALAAGAAGLHAIDYLLPHSQPRKEDSTDEQEKT